jgi:serine/threonine-protein phosphatase 5
LIIVGDTHGQYQDVYNIFRTFGYPSSKNPYLFNGDIVDRGSLGIEILISLFAWKLAIPDSIYINRGNHETDGMNEVYGFQKECEEKYDKEMFRTFSNFFNYLPIGHIVYTLPPNQSKKDVQKVLVTHGGIPIDDNITIEHCQKLNRVCQPPESGPLNDILWSDPQEAPGTAPSARGFTRTFGPDITKKFLQLNRLSMLVRSHELQDEGCNATHDQKCITIFSAPNYIGQMGNQGAILKLVYGDMSVEQFDAMPIPKGYPPMMYANEGV